MNRKFIIGGIVAILLGIIGLLLALSYINRSDIDVDVADPEGLVCEDKQFDILLLVDGSGSPRTYGIDDDLFVAVDAFIDNLNLSSTRLAIMDKRGWGNYSNTGFNTDKTALKAAYKNFGFVGDPACSLFKDSIGGVGCPTEEEKIPNKISQFLDSNQRNVNDKVVPTVIITFDDGDRAQLPQMDEDYNSCNAIPTDLEAWQNLDRYGDMYWIRFENQNSNSCPYWQQPGVMTRGRGTVLEYDYQNGNEVQNLLDQLNTIFEDQCRLVVEVEKTNQIADIDSESAFVDYTVTVTNENENAVQNALVEDILPEQANSVTNIVPADGIYDEIERKIAWNIPTIQQGESLVFTYTIEFLAEDYGELVNSVCIFVDQNNDSNYSSNETESCDESTVVLTTEEIIDPLQIAKTGEVSQTYEDLSGYDAYVSYVLIVSNPNDSVVNNVSVVDTLPDSANNVQLINPTNGVYSEVDGTILWEIESMQPGENLNLSYVVGYNRDQFGDLENIADVYLDINDDNQLQDNELNDTDDNIVSIPTDFGLVSAGIQKNSVTTNINNESATVNYTLEVYNPNNSALSNLIVRDNLPTGSLQVQNIDQSGNYNQSENTIIWNIPTIRANASIQLNYQVIYSSSEYNKDLTNTSVVYLDSNGNGIAEDSEEQDTDTETVNFTADLQANIDKNVVLDFSGAGTIANYTLTILNTGENSFINLRIVDVLDSKILESYLSNIGQATFQNGELVWNLSSLDAGEAIELTYTVTIPEDVGGEFRNTVSLYDSEDNLLDSDTEIFNVVFDSNENTGGNNGGSENQGNGGQTPTDQGTDGGGNQQNSNGGTAGNGEALPSTSILTDKPVLVLLYGAMFVTFGTLLRLINTKKYLKKFFRREDPYIEEVYDDIDL